MTGQTSRDPRTASRRAIVAALAAGIAASATAIADSLAGRFGGPFSLTDHNGRRVTDADFHGRHLLIYFGFTQCVDLCPVDMPVMADALDKLGSTANRLQPLFITVDPATDTPAVLRDYVTAFRPSILGLTGSDAEIAAVTKAYRVHRMRIPNTPAQQQHRGHSHTIDHGSLTYLMGPDGKFLTLIPHGSEAARMAEIIRSYLQR